MNNSVSLLSHPLVSSWDEDLRESHSSLSRETTFRFTEQPAAAAPAAPQFGTIAAEMLHSGSWLNCAGLRKLRRSVSKKRAAAACSHCKRLKMKCDNQRPCGRCASKGLSGSCGDEGETQHGRVPCAVLGGDATEGKEEGLVKAIDLALAQRIDPERPVAFPEGSFCGLVNINPTQSQWPKSLMMTMKLHRYSDAVCHRILNNMSPKLQDAVLRIFRPIDAVFLPVFDGAEPPLPKAWPQASAWENSTRVGVQMVGCDRSLGIMSGINTNTFFTSALAVLRRNVNDKQPPVQRIACQQHASLVCSNSQEEFVHRTFNGDMNIPTSELRQTAKMVVNGALVGIKNGIAEMTGSQDKPERQPLYSRFSKGWGRGGVTEGVLTRMTFSTTYEGLWCYIRSSLIIISPEEYETVRATQPELCEGYLTPVVGSKSAQELMDPRLLVEESFEHMKSCPEGRAQMDKLADLLLDEARFMFDFLAGHNLWTDSPTCLNPTLPAAVHS